MSSTIYAVQPMDGLKHTMTDGDVAASLGEGTIALSELYKHILPKPMTAYSFPPNGTAGEEGVRNGWMTNQLETMMSILSLGIVHKKTKFVDRYPTLTNLVAAEEYLKESTYLSVMLYPFESMRRSNYSLGPLVTPFLYWLLLIMAFPLPPIFISDNGVATGPEMNTWDIKMILFWILLIIIAIALMRTMMFVVETTWSVQGHLIHSFVEFNGADSKQSSMAKVKDCLEGIALRNLNFSVIATVIMYILTGIHYGNKFSNTGNAGLLVTMVFVWIVYTCGIWSVGAYITIVQCTTALISFLINVYTTHFKLLCCKTLSVYDTTVGEKIKLEDNKDIEAYKIVSDRASTIAKGDPLVRAIEKKMVRMEDDLVATMHALQESWKTRLNITYVIVALGYICALFFIYVLVIELDQNQYVDSERHAKYLEVFGIIVGILATFYVLVMPLLAMAAQGDTWKALTETFYTTSYTQAASILHVKPVYFVAKFQALGENIMRWEILGNVLYTPTIIGICASYFISVFLTVAVPAVTAYGDSLKQNEL